MRRRLAACLAGRLVDRFLAALHVALVLDQARWLLVNAVQIHAQALLVLQIRKVHMDIVDCYFRLLGLRNIRIRGVDSNPCGEVVRVLPCDYSDQRGVLPALFLSDVRVVLGFRVHLVAIGRTFEVCC